MAKLKVGVIGLGVGARHAAACASHGACEVAVLCDANQQKLVGVGKRHPGARLVVEAGAVLEDPTIDVVSIASYDADHYKQVVQALEAGKHVFVEKPLCQYKKEAQHIRRLLTERPELVLSSHFPLRRTPLFRELIEDVKAGRYGKLFYISTDYNYGRLEKLTSGWRSAATYYSVVLGGGVHMIDLLLQLTGERVVAVRAMSNKIASAGTPFRFDDCVVSLLQFESGLAATMTCNFGNVSPHVHPLRVYGTKASFEHDLRGAWRYTSRNPKIKPKKIRTLYRQERQDDTTPLIHSFVDAILTGGEPEVTSGQVFEALDVCFTIEKVYSEGCVQRV